MKALARLTAAVICGVAMSGATGAGAAETRVELRHIDQPAVQDFAARFFYKRHPHVLNWSFAQRYRNDENWTLLVRDHGYAGEIDIGPNGAPQLVLTVDDPDWCQANGCLSAIFRKSPRGYELICEAALPPPPQPGPEILSEIENGYRRLATPTDLIEWNQSQNFDSGELCSIEPRRT